MIRLLLCFTVLSPCAGSLSMYAQTKHTPARVAGSAETGQTTYQHYCIMCHAVTPGVKIVGPSLYSVMRGSHASSAKSVREIIVNGKGRMPALGTRLSDQDIADLLAYLRTQ